DQRDRRFGKDAARRPDDLETVLWHLANREQGIILPGDQDIAEPASNKADGRATRARIEHRHLPIEASYEFTRPALVAAAGVKRVGPSREVVPPRAPRGFRIGGNDFDARFDEIGPVADLLWVALAHQKHDGRGVGRTVVRQTPLPIL